MKMQVLLHFLKLVCMCTIHLLCAFVSTKAQNDEPYQLNFADIEITFNKGVQQQLESMTAAYPSEVFLENATQIEAYLHLIEKQLITEKIPTDYKYACLHKLYVQNIDVQRAGFWNLKAEKALLLGLKVNDQVDERFNLISSTYEMMIEVRRNNIYFRNWLVNLITLELSFDEAKEFIREKYPRNELVGAKKWQLNEESHPFIREVLAFKIFMQQKVEPHFTHQVQLAVELNMQFKSLKQIAKEKNKIPSDKVYAILIPEPKERTDNELLSVKVITEITPKETATERIPDEEYVSFVNVANSELSNGSYYSWKKNQDELRAVIAEQERELMQNENPPSQQVEYPLPTVPEVVEAQTHVVIKGQTLYSIAKMYGITVQALRHYNGLDTQKTDIYPDQVLLLQPNNQTQSIQQGGNLIHFVKVGENLASIAKTYSVSVQDIMAWNQFSSESFLEVGQKLIIYVTGQKPRVFKTSNSPVAPLHIQTPYQSQSLTQKLAKYTAEASIYEGAMRGQPSLRSVSQLKRPRLLWLPTIK